MTVTGISGDELIALGHAAIAKSHELILLGGVARGAEHRRWADLPPRRRAHAVGSFSPSACSPARTVYWEFRMTISPRLI